MAIVASALVVELFGEALDVQGRPKSSAHSATRLRICFVWLPRQTLELSPMDQLWRELKRLIAANQQVASINALATEAAARVLALTQQARR
jgi:hypothetical protein